MQRADHFRVVGNQFGHISIWPWGRENAAGWVDVGFDGTRQECLDHIDANVSDLISRAAASLERTS